MRNFDTRFLKIAENGKISHFMKRIGVKLSKFDNLDSLR